MFDANVALDESTHCADDEFEENRSEKPETFLVGNLETDVNLLLCAFKLALNLESITSLVLNLFGSIVLDEKAPILNLVVLNWTQLFNVLLSFVYNDVER
jgi:hypothetical protein